MKRFVQEFFFGPARKQWPQVWLQFIDVGTGEGAGEFRISKILVSRINLKYQEKGYLTKCPFGVSLFFSIESNVEQFF